MTFRPSNSWRAARAALICPLILSVCTLSSAQTSLDPLGEILLSETAILEETAPAEITTLLDMSAFRDLVIDTAKQGGAQSVFTPSTKNPHIFEASYDGDTTPFDLTNTYDDYANNPETGLEASLATLMHLIDGFESNRFEIPLNEAGIGLAIVKEAAIDALLFNDPGLEGDIITRPSLSGLIEVLIGETGEPLSRAEAGRRSEAALWALARGNIDQSLGNLFRDGSIAGTMFYQMQNTPQLTSGLILSDEFWAQASLDYAGPIYFILPRPDELYIIDGNNAAALQTAQHIITSRANYPETFLTGEIFTYKDGNIDIAAL